MTNNLNRVADEFIAGVAIKSKVEERDQGIHSLTYKNSVLRSNTIQ